MDYRTFLKKIQVLSEAFSDSGDEVSISATKIKKDKQGKILSYEIGLSLIGDDLKEKPMKASGSVKNAIEKALGKDDIIKGIEISNDKEVVILYTELLTDEKGKQAIDVGGKTIKL